MINAINRNCEFKNCTLRFSIVFSDMITSALFGLAIPVSLIQEPQLWKTNLNNVDTLRSVRLDTWKIPKFTVTIFNRV